MTHFVIFALAVVLLSSDVNCAKEGVYKPDFEYQHGVIERLVRLEESGKDINGSLKDAIETIKSLKDKLDTLESGSFGSSATFTRWGHTECDGDAEVVYSGYMAGSHFSYSGSGSNYICITSKPVWGEYNNNREAIGLLHGIEYAIGGDIQHQDAPCVVCKIPRSSVIMTPGTNECEDGWTLEYHGYLVAQAFNQQSKEYICLDEKPQVIEGGSAHKEAGYIYKVEGHCGTLKCPPYEDGRELTCAVCSFGLRGNL